MKLVSPPVVVLVAVFAMIIGNLFIPLAELIPPSYSGIGYLVILCGIGITAWTVYVMKPGSNDIHYGSLPRKLITSGPFRYSRNPIYLGMICICLGIAVVLGTLSPFIILVVEWFVFNYILIPPEERMLTETLGERYVQYKNKVRRWL